MRTEDDIKQFDEMETFKTELEPLLDKVAAICKERNIPFMFACNVACDHEKDTIAAGLVDPEMRSPMEMRIAALMVKDQEFFKAANDLLRVGHSIGLLPMNKPSEQPSVALN